MGYEFQRAPTFATGSDITAESISLLADSFNDRIKSGVADCSRRVHISILNSMRNFRNPVDGLFPSQAELLTFYNHVPDTSDSLYPIEDAGTPAGANIANPVNQFVFGAEDGIQGEANRISALLQITPDEETVQSTWDLAKLQRGGIDTASLVEYIGLKPTNPSESSIWKDDAYYWWGINRALFLNSIVPRNYSDIFNFVQDGGSNFIA